MTATPAPQEIIEVRGLHVGYGSVPILKDVTFSVGRGETLAIIGPNGAGKTTLFKALTGEKLPEAGRVAYEARDISRLSADARVKAGIARTFQVARIFPAFTVELNVVLALESRARYGHGRRHLFSRTPDRGDLAEARRILQLIGLAAEAGREARHLSYGDKKRLEIAVAIALQPRVLMLDEPMAGMSPADRGRTTELIARLRDELGLTILLTEHDMDVVFRLAHRIMVLNHGAVVAIGTADEVKADRAVREIYLGAEH